MLVEENLEFRERGIVGLMVAVFTGLPYSLKDWRSKSLVRAVSPLSAPNRLMNALRSESFVFCNGTSLSAVLPPDLALCPSRVRLPGGGSFVAIVVVLPCGYWDPHEAAVPSWFPKGLV